MSRADSPAPGSAAGAPLSDAPAEKRAGAGALAAGIVLALLLLAMFAIALRDASGALEPGSPAPDFEFETFEGQTLGLADLRGRVVVLNFWASWCIPCAVEAPELEALWRDYEPRGVTVLGLAYTDTRPAAREYIERFDISYPNGMDLADRISRLYRLAGVPETLVIDAEGRIVPLSIGGAPPVDRMVGQLGGSQALSIVELRALLDRLLAGEDA